MKAVGIIPARYQSTRLPGKPLLDETGKPMIQHVWERASLASSLGGVIIATDDERILHAARGFGADARITNPSHQTGTDRVAEIAANLGCDIVVNIQGDEPEIDPGAIDAAVEALETAPWAVISTLAQRTHDLERAADPNVVKVVTARDGRALYFSRAPIPFDFGFRPAFAEARPTDGGQARLGGQASACKISDFEMPKECSADSQSAIRNSQSAIYLLHVGLYAYRRDFLLEFSRLPRTPLEQIEKLEQLRAIENGYAIRVTETTYAALGIDTPADYRAFVNRHKQQNQ